MNELRIEVYRRISDKPCTDDVNEANWLVIHKESFIRVDYNERKATSLLSEYPYPFLKAGDKGASGSIIVIPDNPDNAELSAALLLSSSLGAADSGESTDINISRYSELSENSKRNNDIIL